MGLAGTAASAPNAGARVAGLSGIATLGRYLGREAPKLSPQSRAAAADLLRKQGYLVPNQASYQRARAALDARVNLSQPASGISSARGAVSPMAAGDPDIDPQWEGVNDANVTPPDTTGAIGPTRYIELVNDKYGIYDRSGNPVATGGLKAFAGANTNFVTDPQIIWDPGTNRFYFVVLEFSHYVGGPNPEIRLYVGFSRTASPSSASSTDWCRKILSYGDFLPDYPKLGDSSAFFMIGVNTFFGDSYVGSDVVWMTKPPAGTGCPGITKFHIGAKFNLKEHDGSDAFTPVPVNQTDSSTTGYVVSASESTQDFVDTFRVTRNSKGNAVFSAGTAHPVTSFSVPPSAPQSGTPQLLDTLDTRLTNSVSGTDPSKGKLAIWTQHTVATNPPGRSEVRWYEIIDPNTIGAPARSGALTDGSLYVFNGAISPDRKVSGAVKRFGDSFVVGFNTSSGSDFVRIQMASQWADHPMSGFVEVQASPGFNDDFSCYQAPAFTCRWGDYSGATPDPASNAFSNHGRVWLSNQWNMSSANSNDVDWRTYNW
jgi:hypothetical protein